MSVSKYTPNIWVVNIIQPDQVTLVIKLEKDKWVC